MTSAFDRNASWTTLLAAFVISLSLPAAAESVADFYKGKRLSIYVGAEAGGYDSYARLVSRHIGRFIPGNPEFVVVNMPGGGGLRVSNYLYNVAPKDGTALGILQRTSAMAPLLESRNTELKYDPLKFNWLGSLNTETGLIVVSSAAPHKSMKDLFEKELVVGSSGPATEFMPLFLNNVLGTKFKIISGYKGSTDVYLALERGEVQGRICNGWSGDKAILTPWLEQKKVHFVAQVAVAKSSLFPDVPLILDFARTDRERQAMELILSSQMWGRPFMMPPGVPQDRLEAMKDAFRKMMADSEFLAEAGKLSLDIDPVPGEEMDKILHRVYATPPDIVDMVRKAIAANK
jgi:tripartite-type tricarboxylate transporter receptor subunit TctC